MPTHDGRCADARQRQHLYEADVGGLPLASQLGVRFAEIAVMRGMYHHGDQAEPASPPTADVGSLTRRTKG